jgi:hypothetical protein
MRAIRRLHAKFMKEKDLLSRLVEVYPDALLGV